jgi:hypothetical protein
VQCAFCAGWTTFSFSPTTFSLQVGAQQQFTLTSTDNYGYNDDLTPWADWETSNSSIVALNSGPGWATGVGGGTATVTASSQPIPYFHGECCVYGGPVQCPLVPVGGSATGQVHVPTDSRIVSEVTSYPMNTGSSPGCPPNQAGWYRRVRKVVTDDETPPQDITVNGSTINESLGLTSENGLNLGSPTPFPPVLTSGAGNFDDQFGFCSPLCPGSTGETDLTQVLTDQPAVSGTAYTLRTQTLQYTCSGDKDNGN